MQVWQWMVEHPEMVSAGMPIAAAPQTSPWVIALNAVGRQAIYNDPEWQGGDYRGSGPAAGLALARMIGMISYRTEPQFRERFGRTDTGQQSLWAADGGYQVESYLRYQGQKLVDRFDARSYVLLTRTMDNHDVSRGWGSLDTALKRITSRVLVVGVDHDVLFPVAELMEAASRLSSLGGDVVYGEINSQAGHDAFLVELDQLNHLIAHHLAGRKEQECVS
jgi:homoserine O-acetyltransferase